MWKEPTLEDVIFLLVLLLIVGFLSVLIGRKFKVDYEYALLAVLFVFLIAGELFVLVTDFSSYPSGVRTVPPWGRVAIVIGLVIMLIMLIRHWLKQKKDTALKRDKNCDEGSDANNDARASTAAPEAPENLEDKK